jgi:hypothetical protein
MYILPDPLSDMTHDMNNPPGSHRSLTCSNGRHGPKRQRSARLVERATDAHLSQNSYSRRPLDLGEEGGIDLNILDRAGRSPDAEVVPLE